MCLARRNITFDKAIPLLLLPCAKHDVRYLAADVLVHRKRRIEGRAKTRERVTRPRTPVPTLRMSNRNFGEYRHTIQRFVCDVRFAYPHPANGSHRKTREEERVSSEPLRFRCWSCRICLNDLTARCRSADNAVTYEIPRPRSYGTIHSSVRASCSRRCFSSAAVMPRVDVTPHSCF